MDAAFAAASGVTRPFFAAPAAEVVWAGEAVTRGPPDVVAEDDVIGAVPRVVGVVEAGAKGGLRPDRVEVVASVTDLAVLDKCVLVAAVEIDAVCPGAYMSFVNRGSILCNNKTLFLLK